MLTGNYWKHDASCRPTHHQIMAVGLRLHSITESKPISVLDLKQEMVTTTHRHVAYRLGGLLSYEVRLPKQCFNRQCKHVCIVLSAVLTLCIRIKEDEPPPPPSSLLFLADHDIIRLGIQLLFPSTNMYFIHSWLID